MTLNSQIFVWKAVDYNAHHFPPLSFTKQYITKSDETSSHCVCFCWNKWLISTFTKEINGLFGVDVTDLNTNSGKWCVQGSSRWLVYRLKMLESNGHNHMCFLTEILHSRVIFTCMEWHLTSLWDVLQGKFSFNSNFVTCILYLSLKHFKFW